MLRIEPFFISCSKGYGLNNVDLSESCRGYEVSKLIYFDKSNS